MIQIGLIGAGNISQTHADAAAQIEGARVVAVCGRTREHADRLAARAGAAAYDDLERFLAYRPMDMVVIGSPSGLHAEQGIAAARHGLHVLTEKPIDTSTSRADRLIAEAARAGVTLGVIFQDRMKPDIARLKALIDAGRLGMPILASASVRWHRPLEYYKGSAWRGTQALDGGGALMNQGVHTVDLLLWLFGPVRRVFGKVTTRLHAIEVGHGGGHARVRERRDRHDRSGDVGVPGIRAADRAHRIGRDREARRRSARGDRSPQSAER